ncbi:hypothetical protein [Nitriliruptor alkaliphilus]|uniref:hypothetical protein n=1 Tax=Nitriliruptor alkaliphilus TaxID=427918 RepID=UPI000695AB91|nr:hypothetical protein [Nitriliruptor alkaliphilus]
MEPLRPSLPPVGPDQVVVHTSVRGLLAAAVTPLVLVALGAAALIDGRGPAIVPLVLLLVGLAAGLVAVGDMPRRVEFDRTGLTRVCLLRRQRVPWERVVAIERSRPSSATVARNVVERRESKGDPRISGGLIARGRPRGRWLLTDRVESREEHDELRRLLEHAERPVAMRAPPPHDGVPPTHLYRRRQRGS